MSRRNSGLGTFVHGCCRADQFPGRLGLSGATGDWTLSKAIGMTASDAILVASAMETARLLGFEEVARIVAARLGLGGDILMAASSLPVASNRAAEAVQIARQFREAPAWPTLHAWRFSC